MIFKGKKILITGSEGMIGKELSSMLECSKQFPHTIVQRIDVKKWRRHDLRDFRTCLDLCEDVDYVFHLAGIKGSPKRTKERPVDFMGPMLQFDTNMIIAAQMCGVKRFLYTSSIAVEHPLSDLYPAWAKKTAEVLIEAMKIQYPKGTKYCVVRPANVYGRFDDFDSEFPMVITSLIKNALTKRTLKIWGKGDQVRDFINSKDVARGMIKAMCDMVEDPVNLCSGKGVMIKQIANIISKETKTPLEFVPTKGEVLGDKKRVMKLNWDFKPEIKIKQGIKEVIRWIKR